MRTVIIKRYIADEKVNIMERLVITEGIEIPVDYEIIADLQGVKLADFPNGILADCVDVNDLK